MEQVARLIFLAADDERVLAAELTLDGCQRLPHGGGIGFVGEIDKRFVFEWRNHNMSSS